jgi:sulfate transporter 3
LRDPLNIALIIFFLQISLFFQLNNFFTSFETGSFSRSAVNYNAGSKTAVSNIVMASAVLVTMLFLMPLFYHTPNVILSAIIITAVIGLIDFGAAARLWKVDKIDFLAFISAFVGVLFISVQGGLAIAVRAISNSSALIMI